MFRSSDSAEDYVAYDSGPDAIRTISAIVAVATFFVALRIWTGWYYARGWGWDDWLSVASTVVLWAEFADGILSIQKAGVGKHLSVNLIDDPSILSRAMVVSGNTRRKPETEDS